jgi:hypothetical protein
VVADAVWYAMYEWETELSVTEFGIGISGSAEGKSEGSALDGLLLEDVSVLFAEYGSSAVLLPLGLPQMCS